MAARACCTQSPSNPAPVRSSGRWHDRWSDRLRRTLDGQVFGPTKGEGSAKVEYCIGCHISVTPEVDSLFFMPEDYRVH
jgi:hypothetical protein